MNVSIKPTAEHRRDFARWAVSNHVRTESQNSFAVPEDLLDQIPEEHLDGALIDGQEYFGETLLGVSWPEPEAETETETDTETETETETDTETETEYVSETDTETEYVSDTDTETEYVSDTETEVPF